MTRTRTTTTVQLLLAMTAALALAAGLAFASPAAAQFVDEDGQADAGDEQHDDGHDGQETPEPAADDHDAPESDGNGFVGDDREAAPVGGVDAGFGGGAEQAAGFGVPHAAAVALLGLALTGHLANARRTATVRA